MRPDQVSKSNSYKTVVRSIDPRVDAMSFDEFYVTNLWSFETFSVCPANDWLLWRFSVGFRLTVRSRTSYKVCTKGVCNCSRMSSRKIWEEQKWSSSRRLSGTGECLETLLLNVCRHSRNLVSKKRLTNWHLQRGDLQIHLLPFVVPLTFGFSNIAGNANDRTCKGTEISTRLY